MPAKNAHFWQASLFIFGRSYFVRDLPHRYEAKSQQGMKSFFYEGKTSTKTRRQEVNFDHSGNITTIPKQISS